MLKLALLLSCLPSLASAGYVLRPTTEIDADYTVTVDQQPSPALGRCVAVPQGATLTLSAVNHKPFSAVLIGPSGIVDRARQNGSWSTRLVEGGGYRLQFGPDNALYPLFSEIDFVVVADAASAPTAGTMDAEALYRQP